MPYPSIDGRSSRSSGIAERAREIVLANFADPDRSRTSSIARSLGVSESHLCHAYRSAFDRTIGQDVRRLRIAMARHLLERTDRLIKEVAAECGYGRAAYRTFLNAFRAETEMAPSEYRANGRGGVSESGPAVRETEALGRRAG
jgi:AraC-like DNA-binding protein